MFRKILCLSIVLFCSISFAQGVPEPARPMIQLPDGSLVGPSNPLPTTVSSDTIGLKAELEEISTELKSPAQWEQQTISLSANVAQNIASEITSERRYIILKAFDETKRFWVSVDGTATVDLCTPVDSWCKLDIPKSITASIIASEAMSISVLEAGE